jgi:hypothetical protein
MSATLWQSCLVQTATTTTQQPCLSWEVFVSMFPSYNGYKFLEVNPHYQCQPVVTPVALDSTLSTLSALVPGRAPSSQLNLLLQVFPFPELMEAGNCWLVEPHMCEDGSGTRIVDDSLVQGKSFHHDDSYGEYLLNGSFNLVNRHGGQYMELGQHGC